MMMEMKKVEVEMKKPLYLAQAILDISKTLMYELRYDYIKPKYDYKARLCYMDTDSFVMNIKAEDFYKDIADDVERLFDTSNYDEKDKRPLPIGKNKKVIGFFKDELGGKIMTENLEQKHMHIDWMMILKRKKLKAGLLCGLFI